MSKEKSRLVNRVQFSTTIGKDTMKRLRDYSDRTMIPIARIIDVAVSEYLDKVDKKEEQE